MEQPPLKENMAEQFRLKVALKNFAQTLGRGAG
jgi:hypothetical protein